MAITLTVLTALILAASRYCFRKVFLVRREATLAADAIPKGAQYEAAQDTLLALIRRAEAIPFESVEITNRDGLTLHARYYETRPGAPLQIQCHGYRSNPLRDFCGGLTAALDSGCNVLLIDQRAHGKSEGRCLSFGILERMDCLDWVNYACGRFGTEIPIILMGVSMGAATVLMASELPLPQNVRGIIADCGYSSPRAIIRRVMEKQHYPLFPLYPLIRLSGILWGGFDIEAASPESALKHCRIPVLFIHGEDDRFVPCDMSRINFAACVSEKTLLTIPGAGHGLSYVVGRTAYLAAVQDFLEKAIG